MDSVFHYTHLEVHTTAVLSLLIFPFRYLTQRLRLVETYVVTLCILHLMCIQLDSVFNTVEVLRTTYQDVASV